MVVIRDNKKFLVRTFGPEFIERLQEFAWVIGFTAEIEEDEVKVEFNPDRPDLFSFYSLDSAMKLFYKDIQSKRPDFTQADFDVNITGDALSIRPYFLCFIASGPALGEKLPRIIEYQERLHDTIGRERRDVSVGIHSLRPTEKQLSYNMEDTSSIRLKTFDGELEGTALDILNNHPTGQKYVSLLPSSERINAIKDSAGNVLSIPPVINSYRSRITTDSSTIFVDIEGVQELSVIQSLLLLAYEFNSMGYSVFIPRMHGIERKLLERVQSEGERKIEISRQDIDSVLGYSPESSEISLALEKMGYMFKLLDKKYTISIPGNRIDIMGAVDVIEDIAKGIGYDKIPFSEIPPETHGASGSLVHFFNDVRQILIGSGYQEVKSYVVGSQHPYEKGILNYRGGVKLVNPKSQDFSVVRDRLFAGMMDIIKQNRSRQFPQKIFEIGDVLIEGKQRTHLCFILHDNHATFSSAKQVLEYVVGRLTSEKVEIKHSLHDGLVKGRTGDIILSGKVVGYIGEMHPELLQEYQVDTPVSLVEVDILPFLELT